MCQDFFNQSIYSFLLFFSQNLRFLLSFPCMVISCWWGLQLRLLCKSLNFSFLDFLQWGFLFLLYFHFQFLDHFIHFLPWFVCIIRFIKRFINIFFETVIIFTKATLRSLSFDSAILQFWGTFVVVLLSSNGYTLSWLSLIVVSYWCLCIWVHKDCNSRQ